MAPFDVIEQAKLIPKFQTPSSIFQAEPPPLCDRNIFQPLVFTVLFFWSLLTVHDKGWNIGLLGKRKWLPAHLLLVNIMVQYIAHIFSNIL